MTAKEEAARTMEMHCHSCAAPLANPEFTGAVADYCKYCTDETGKVKSRDQVHAGVKMWMTHVWNLSADDPTLDARADNYLRAMPHWSH